MVFTVAGHVEHIRGEWIPGSTAGGSRNDLESFSKNPQYLLSLHEPGNKEIRKIYIWLRLRYKIENRHSVEKQAYTFVNNVEKSSFSGLWR